MKNGSINYIIIQYIKYHQKSILIFCVFSFIFAAVFSLYDLHVEAVWYSIILCICTGFIFAAFDLLKFYKKHRLLTRLQNKIMLSIEGLPHPEDLPEEDYQALIAAVYQDKARSTLKAENDRSSLVDYFTIWAHQIKTPISAMRLLMQAEEYKRNIELEMELFKIEQYVEMVLQYLRVDSTSTDYILKQYSLDEIVRQAVRKYAKLFILKKISLEYTELNCKVLTDEKWLLFVIEQIISNALKYTQTGKISIYMESSSGNCSENSIKNCGENNSENEEGASKVLVIADTGIGIQEEDLPRVFEKGYTGYNGRADKKSTGIGLYLCKRILTKLSHTISIESKVGQGTKVKIGNLTKM